MLPSIVVPLCAYLQACFGSCTGMSCSDSTALAVCHTRQHKLFAGITHRGKPSLRWLYGVTVHLVVHDRGELLGVQRRPGTTDDRTPAPSRARQRYGKLFGDTRYLSHRYSTAYAPTWASR